MAKEEIVGKKMAKFKVNLKKAIKYYYVFTKPMHNLPERSVEILTEIVFMYVSQEKNIIDPNDRWKIVFDRDNRYKIRESLNMHKQVFENYMTSLRKAGAIVDNKVSPAFYPAISLDQSGFEIVFKFEIVDG
jgi:hypothetical protein